MQYQAPTVQQPSSLCTTQTWTNFEKVHSRNVKNGLTTSQIRKKCVHDLGLTLRKFDVTNIKERENLKKFKMDANDHISSLTYATDNFICEHNLKEISDLKNAVIIIKSTTTETSGKILLLDSTHKISR